MQKRSYSSQSPSVTSWTSKYIKMNDDDNCWLYCIVMGVTLCCRHGRKGRTYIAQLQTQMDDGSVWVWMLVGGVGVNVGTLCE